MLIESCSIPKTRDLSRPGDDVLAVLPGRLYAVFDGVTDASGNQVQGMSPGRFAAGQAALTMMTHAMGPDRDSQTPAEWLVSMNLAIRQGLGKSWSVRVGTTAAVVEDAGGDNLRFLIVGDSGIRINGHELIWLTKDVDLIYTAGRVAIFRQLAASGLTGDALEARTRQLVVAGLSGAAHCGLAPSAVAAIVDDAQRSCAPRLKPDAVNLVADLLHAGIAGGQSAYCNRLGHSLGYAVLDGGQTRGPGLLSFSRPKSSVHSIELFTDGYMSCPQGARVPDWEAEFFRVEAEDFTKTAAYASAKGSTSTTFSDDRSVLVVHF